MNRFCTNCGAVGVGTAAFCGACGGKLGAGATVATPLPSVVEGREPELFHGLLRAFRDRSAQIIPRRAREALDQVAQDQLEVMRDVVRSPEAQALGRRVVDIDNATGGTMQKGVFALRQILRAKRQG